MTKEMIWFALPVIALLSQLGGTFKKQYRRIGIPSLLTAVYLLYYGWSWWLPLLWLSAFLPTTMPFTLLGDGVPSHWFNWVWIWIWASMYTLCPITVCLMKGGWVGYLFSSILPIIVLGLMGTLSNVKATANLFPWKLVEGFGIGLAYAPALWALTQ